MLNRAFGALVKHTKKNSDKIAFYTFKTLNTQFLRENF
jgi:hypothetical protein